LCGGSPAEHYGWILKRIAAVGAAGIHQTVIQDFDVIIAGAWQASPQLARRFMRLTRLC